MISRISIITNNFHITRKNSKTYNDVCIIKSTRSISQKSKFYKRTVSKFLYTKCNQRSIFYSLYWEYELKILHVTVKLAHLDIYFTEKLARRRLTWLTVLLRLQHFSCFSNFRAKIIDYFENCFKQKLSKI